MNIKVEDISINQINNLNLFDHEKELKESSILFTKIENDN
tara:strand:+ start:191 stop:310 length:120 start_codon:yes stop_codon:yes gene_type:complete